MCVFLIFTVKGAVVCKEVSAILRLSFPVHHPGTHVKRRRDAAGQTAPKMRIKLCNIFFRK